MAAGTMMKVLCAMVACMMLSAPYSEAIFCSQVSTALVPCQSYLRTGEGAVPPRCCYGVKAINSAATTTSDKKTACGCLKIFNRRFPGLKADLIIGLPEKCGVSMPYFNTALNCSKVEFSGLHLDT